jgi:hypothetical protein
MKCGKRLQTIAELVNGIKFSSMDNSKRLHKPVDSSILVTTQRLADGLGGDSLLQPRGEPGGAEVGVQHVFQQLGDLG